MEAAGHVLPIFGVRAGADLEVVVVRGSDGKVDAYARCLCAACGEVDHVGLLEAMGFDESTVAEGVYYYQHWSSSYSTPLGMEYESGLELTEGTEDG